MPIKKASPQKKASHAISTRNSTRKTLEIQEKIDRALCETQSKQARRLVNYLLINGPSTTTEVASSCAIGNISHAANLVRPALRKYGLDVVAELPRPMINNRFGERSQIHIWRLTGA